MNKKSVSLIASMALLTAVCLAGSIYLIFLVLSNILASSLGVRFHLPLVGYVIVFAFTMFAPALFFGGVWGWGIKRLLRVEANGVARIGALAWSATVVVTGLGLYFAQIPIARLEGAYPVSMHFMFTLAFVPVVGLAAGLNTRLMTGKLGLEEFKNAVGRNAGVAAALRFFIISLGLLFFFEWEVGGPFAGNQYSMIKIMHLCNAGAALAGGAAMGWTLVSREGVATSDLSGA